MTIIVLLILAGVSLNAIVGENGIITQAITAKAKMEDSDRREKIEMMVTEYVSKTVDVEESLPSYLESRKGKEIDDALQVPDPNGSGGRVNAVIKDGHYYIILEENGNYRVEEMNTDLGEIGGGITLATPENFDKEKNGTMEFNPGKDGKSTLVFSEKIEDEFCFDIQSGEVTIYIDDDMTLTNSEQGRSAINIEPNAKLDLYIAENAILTVDSGIGATAPVNNGSGERVEGGHYAYAGIRVPWIDLDNDDEYDENEFGTLSLHGGGTLISYGGDASDGGTAISGDAGGGRRSVEQELVLVGNRWKRWRFERMV